MKLSLLFVLLTCVSCISCVSNTKNKKTDIKLWYDSPANSWIEALPVGNGRVGAMVYSGINQEHIQFNDNTLYSGEPSTEYRNIRVTPQGKDSVYQFLKSGDFKKATSFIAKNWMGRLHQYYQPFGDVFITNNVKGNVADYRRELILSDAITKTTYSIGDTIYEREVFASHPDDLIIIRLKSNKKNSINVSLKFDSPHKTAKYICSDDRLILKGQAPGYIERRTYGEIENRGDKYKYPELFDKEGKRKFDHRILYGDEIDNKGMFFEAELKPVCPNGRVKIEKNGIKVDKTDEVYFLLSMATSFNGYDKSPSREGVDSHKIASEIIQKASGFSYKELKNRHLADYKELFDRVQLNLNSPEEILKMPTDQRIVQFDEVDDPDLAAMVFQYGRYLMISGSRPGGQAMNLQGIWNNDTIPGWNCIYTVNINTQMNYWPAEVTNLSECHEPLFNMLKELSVAGSKTAKNMYGMRGWVVHHNTGLWRETYPVDNVPSASLWPTAQGWLASHLWEHYLFTKDEKFLKEEAYPIIKGCAEFLSDWLVKDENGYWITPVGISPENYFLSPSDGKQSAYCIAPTMDMAIIRESFARTIYIAKKFNIDNDFRKELDDKLQYLAPYKVGSKGQLLEWDKEYKELNEHFGHISHLYPFFPGDQITPDNNSNLLKAVSTSLKLRGDDFSCWPAAWRICMAARLFDGETAYKYIKNMIRPVEFGSSNKKYYQGMARNMFNRGAIFQIDGNLGYTAGVAEMLLQSHDGYISLLPALPESWSKGNVKGLKARGNFEVSMSWDECILQKANIRSLSGENCKIRTAYPIIVKENNKEIVRSSKQLSNVLYNYYEVDFPTRKNGLYSIELL